jgi:hypothetical protein
LDDGWCQNVAAPGDGRSGVWVACAEDTPGSFCGLRLPANALCCWQIMSFLNNIATVAARNTLNSRYLQPYGMLTKLDIDSHNKSLLLVLDLKGESQPLEIQVKHYQLIDRNGDTFFEPGEIETSREWVNTLLREHLLEKVIRPKLRETPLPSMVKLLL